MNSGFSTNESGTTPQLSSATIPNQHVVPTSQPSFPTSTASAFGSFITRSLGSMVSTIGSTPSSEFSFPSPVAQTSQDPSSIFSFPTHFITQSSQASTSTSRTRRSLFGKIFPFLLVTKQVQVPNVILHLIKCEETPVVNIVCSS